MRTAIKCCCMSTESQFPMRRVSNYCSLLFLVLVLSTSSWFIYGASAQTPSGTLRLVGPSTDPLPGEEFVVNVEILNPQNVYVFTIAIEYPDVLELSPPNAIEPAEGQFESHNLNFDQVTQVGEDRVERRLVLGNNTDLISGGTLLTIKFETSETGNHRIAIRGDHDQTLLQNNAGLLIHPSDNELPRLTVPVPEALQGTVKLVPSTGPEGANITGIRVDEPHSLI